MWGLILMVLFFGRRNGFAVYCRCMQDDESPFAERQSILHAPPGAFNYSRRLESPWLVKAVIGHAGLRLFYKHWNYNATFILWEKFFSFFLFYFIFTTLWFLAFQLLLFCGFSGEYIYYILCFWFQWRG